MAVVVDSEVGTGGFPHVRLSHPAAFAILMAVTISVIIFKGVVRVTAVLGAVRMGISNVIAGHPNVTSGETDAVTEFHLSGVVNRSSTVFIGETGLASTTVCRGVSA